MYQKVVTFLSLLFSFLNRRRVFLLLNSLLLDALRLLFPFSVLPPRPWSTVVFLLLLALQQYQRLAIFLSIHPPLFLTFVHRLLSHRDIQYFSFSFSQSLPPCSFCPLIFEGIRDHNYLDSLRTLCASRHCENAFSVLFSAVIQDSFLLFLLNLSFLPKKAEETS